MSIPHQDPSALPPREFRESPASATLGYLIFASRWLQAPLYLGLIIAQLVYVIVFGFDLAHLIEDVWNGIWHIPYVVDGVTLHHELSEATIMLTVLGLIDVVMIANLLIMVIIGGYEIFVSRIKVDGHPDEPDWLSHVNANLLKIKLAISIISISSIHLLKTFIEVGDLGARGAHSETGEVYTWDGVLWQVLIHMAFIFSALALAWIDKMSHGIAPAGSKAAKKLAQQGEH